MKRRNSDLKKMSEVIADHRTDHTTMRGIAAPAFKARIKAAHEMGQVGFVMVRVVPAHQVEPVLLTIENTLRGGDAACIALPGTILILLTGIPAEETVEAVIKRLRNETSYGMNAKVRYSGMFIPYPQLEYHKIVSTLETALLAEYEADHFTKDEGKSC